jgi:FkbM family methyltransferase
MLLVSQIVDLAARLGGPRVAHRIELKRMERWRNFEREFYLLDHLVDPARAAVDVGANEGHYAGRMAQLTQRVHCFEPIPWFAEALRRKLDPRVEVHEAAVSNREGEGVLRIPYRGETEMHGTSTLETGNALEGSDRVREVPVKLVRLDDVVREPVGFLKVDVEGHELAVLEGAARILREDQPVVLVETEARHAEGAPFTVFRFLEGLGYTGCFLLGGQPRRLSGFSLAEHQRVENVMQRGKLYINNFIFF